MRVLWILGLMASPVAAETLDGAGVTAALTGQKLVYDDGTSQSFPADGRTLFFAKDGSQSIGHWAVRGDQYCSVWPPSDHWACYGVTKEGDSIGFVSQDGTVTMGHSAP